MIPASAKFEISGPTLLARGISTTAASLSVVYAVLAAAHQVVLEPPGALMMTTTALLSAFVLAAIAWLNRGRRRIEWANLSAFAIMCVALVNSGLHLAIVREAHHSISLLILALCAGFFLTEAKSLCLMLTLCFGTWLGVSLMLIPTTEWVHYGFAWFVVGSLSILAHTTWRSSLEHLRQLMHSQRKVSEALQHSLHEAGRELTDRRRAERELRRSEARKSAILESSIHAIIEIDMDGRVIDANPMATELLGYKHHQLVGGSLARLVVPARLREAHLQAVRKYVETREVRILGKRLSLYALHRDGHEIPVEVTVQAVALEGETLSFVGFIRDLRAQVANEAALREAKELAERSSGAKSALLANVSHELRTPMSAIIGMTELVLQTELSDAQRHFLSRSHSAAESLLWMVDGLLDLAKIEAGYDEASEDEFDLIELVERTTSSLALGAELKGLHVELVLAPDLPDRVVGDAMRLRQVLSNLLANAIKFTETGWVRLDVSARLVEVSLACLEFAVSDTGPGIDERDRQRIFEAFEQIEPRTRRGSQQGVGLGLSIAHRWVKQAARTAGRRGELRYEDRSGGGSCFRFPWYVELLPSRPAVATHRASQAIIIGQPTVVMQSLCSQLEGEGVSCRWLPEGACADTEPYDFAVVDGLALDLSDSSWLTDLKGPIALLLSMEALGRDPVLPSFVLPCGLPVSGRTLLRSIEDSRASTEEAVVVSEDALRILVVDDDDSNRLFAAEAFRRAGHWVEVSTGGEGGVEAFGQSRFDLALVDLRMPGMDGIEAI